MCSAIGMCGKSTAFNGNRGSSGSATVLRVLDDALATRLTRLAGVAKRDLDADLVLAHEVVTDGTAQTRDHVLLRRDALRFLDGVGHVRLFSRSIADADCSGGGLGFTAVL